MKLSYVLTICCLLPFAVAAQDSTTLELMTTLEGYVYEKDNRGFLRNARITVFKLNSQEVYAEALTNKKGVFTVELPTDLRYTIVAKKKSFFDVDTTVSTVGIQPGSKVFAKLEMERKPGYIFDVTIAEADTVKTTVNAIQGARIEVFNNTKGKEELILNDYPYPNFKFNFEKGNYYTLMIRKEGYITKRIEAYIDIEDCILCFDGLGIINPGVTDVMAHGLEIGTFLANIDMEKIEINKTFALDNIYYDYNKWDIRKDAAEELDKLVTVLKDNPAIIVEMGSHTDARGKDQYNMNLSQKRARSAADYLVSQGISNARLTWKGYGETQLSNDCEDGINCDEVRHQANRRTELKIVGVIDEDPLEEKSLREIIAHERMLKDVMEGEVIRVDNNTKKDRAQN